MMPLPLNVALDQTFSELFHFLQDAAYEWEPLSPDRLLKSRHTPENFSPLVRYFGLGMEYGEAELMAEGISPELARKLTILRPAISRSGARMLAHSHFGPIYLGQESFELLRLLEDRLESFVGKSLLDLGSGAGALSLETAALAKNILGIEASEVAVQWARAAARAQRVDNVQFECARIGTAQAEGLVGRQTWDLAVFNPPMAVSKTGEERPQRDGGDFGIELPLLFLDFAGRHLKVGGEVFCLATNPIVHGRSKFFDRLDHQVWETLERRCLNDHFNQSLHRKHGYAERGIQRIELWYLHLKKIL